MTLYLYDSFGGLHVATLVYSAYDYLADRGAAPLSISVRGSLAPYARPLTLRLDPGSLAVSEMGFEADVFWKAIGLKEPGVEAPEGSCPEALTQVYWTWLYYAGLPYEESIIVV